MLTNKTAGEATLLILAAFIGCGIGYWTVDVLLTKL